MCNNRPEINLKRAILPLKPHLSRSRNNGIFSPSASETGDEQADSIPTYTRLILSFLTKMVVSVTYESLPNSETGQGEGGAVFATGSLLPKETGGLCASWISTNSNDQQ